jgi:hypothetical protein
MPVVEYLRKTISRRRFWNNYSGRLQICQVIVAPYTKSGAPDRQLKCCKVASARKWSSASAASRIKQPAELATAGINVEPGPFRNLVCPHGLRDLRGQSFLDGGGLKLLQLAVLPQEAIQRAQSIAERGVFFFVLVMTLAFRLKFFHPPSIRNC